MALSAVFVAAFIATASAVNVAPKAALLASNMTNHGQSDLTFTFMGRKWKPEPCGELEPGVPCRTLYKYPQGSTFVAPCPTSTVAVADGCAAQFTGKSDAEKCPQLTCPKALGVEMKLICGGGCCPTCWAPDHVLALDRHTAMGKSPYATDPAPQAPTTCTGVKCFKPVCASGLKPGHVQGDCCYSCTPTR